MRRGRTALIRKRCEEAAQAQIAVEFLKLGYLESANIALVGKVGRENFLKKALRKLENMYDYVVIDSNPSLSIITLNVGRIKHVAAAHAERRAELSLRVEVYREHLFTSARDTVCQSCGGRPLSPAPPRHIMVFADEAHLFIDKNCPTAVNFFYQMNKRIRKYYGSFIPTTQNISDWNAILLRQSVVNQRVQVLEYGEVLRLVITAVGILVNNFQSLFANKNQIVANAQMLLLFRFLDGEVLRLVITAVGILVNTSCLVHLDGGVVDELKHVGVALGHDRLAVCCVRCYHCLMVGIFRLVDWHLWS